MLDPALPWTRRRVRVDGPEDGMSRDHLVDRLPQAGEVDTATHPQHERNMVGRRTRIELMVNPHAALRICERQELRHRESGGCRAGLHSASGAGITRPGQQFVDTSRDSRDRACFEDLADPDVRTGRRRQPRRPAASGGASSRDALMLEPARQAVAQANVTENRRWVRRSRMWT